MGHNWQFTVSLFLVIVAVIFATDQSQGSSWSAWWTQQSSGTLPPSSASAVAVSATGSGSASGQNIGSSSAPGSSPATTASQTSSPSASQTYSSSGATYTNPIYNVIGAADPWVIKHTDGWYYMTYTTNDNVTILRSKILTYVAFEVFR